jgi:hypothetical protein
MMFNKTEDNYEKGRSKWMCGSKCFWWQLLKVQMLEFRYLYCKNCDRFKWIQSLFHIHVYIKRTHNTRQFWLHWSWHVNKNCGSLEVIQPFKAQSNILTLYVLPIQFMCLVSTPIASSYSIKCLVVVMVEQSVLCEVWNKFYSQFGEFESQKRWAIFGDRSGPCSARVISLYRPSAFREADNFWAG